MKGWPSLEIKVTVSPKKHLLAVLTDQKKKKISKPLETVFSCLVLCFDEGVGVEQTA